MFFFFAAGMWGLGWIVNRTDPNGSIKTAATGGVIRMIERFLK